MISKGKVQSRQSYFGLVYLLVSRLIPVLYLVALRLHPLNAPQRLERLLCFLAVLTSRRLLTSSLELRLDNCTPYPASHRSLDIYTEKNMQFTSHHKKKKKKKKKKKS
ncbi:hypothetical protein HanRHA438_Chr16g0788061 [Helianthus annuus]|nr:hypothetical protein HanRHA438_Chr16g0788061 [Helianthus annuus]